MKMNDTEFEVTCSALRRECEWCGDEITAGLDCLVLREEDDDYYFCGEACAKGYDEGLE